jgi:hypothetical protein
MQEKTGGAGDDTFFLAILIRYNKGAVPGPRGKGRFENHGLSQLNNKKEK